MEDDVTDMFDAVRCGIIPRVDGLDNSISTLVAPEETGQSGEVEEEGLLLEFLAAGEPRFVRFETGRLGMTFNNDMPLKVTRVALGSAARALGVERGWELVAIGGETLEGHSWREALEKLKASTAALPAPNAEPKMPMIREDAAQSESSWSQSDRSSLLQKNAKAFPDDLQSSVSTPSTTITSLTDITFDDAPIDRLESQRGILHSAADPPSGRIFSPRESVQNVTSIGLRPAVLGNQTERDVQTTPPDSFQSCLPRPVALGAASSGPSKSAGKNKVSI